MMGTWLEASHPRNAKGTGGGEFRTGTASKQATPAKKGSKAPSGGSLSYNGKTGTGYGSAHGDPRVRKLQTALNRLHLTDANGKPLAIDGKLGPKTTAAIKKWQRKNGMKPTGAVSAGDLAKLSAPRHAKASLTRKKAPMRRP
jgi:putative chitinase